MRRLITAASVLLLVACGGSHDQPSRPVTVLAAISLKSALDDVDTTVLRRNGLQVRLAYAGTPQLARQVEAGAPADIFISADDGWMDALARGNHIQVATRTPLVGNTLVLIAPADSDATVDPSSASSWRSALGDGRLAIADPESVPAGRYAREALTARGVWAALADRLAPHENVRAALAFVARGEAPLGIVYGSDAAEEPKVRVLVRFDARDHSPIHYPAALTTTAQAAARGVLTELLSPASRTVFQRHGLTAPAS